MRQAFDCISGQALMLALQRFGISQPMMEAIADIYTDRSFCVSDEGHMSMARPVFSKTDNIVAFPNVQIHKNEILKNVAIIVPICFERVWYI